MACRYGCIDLNIGSHFFCIQTKPAMITKHGEEERGLASPGNSWGNDSRGKYR